MTRAHFEMLQHLRTVVQHLIRMKPEDISLVIEEIEKTDNGWSPREIFLATGMLDKASADLEQEVRTE